MKLINRDHLANERTKLANERTLLSYIRTALYFLLGGIALIQIEGLENVALMGYLSLFISAALLAIGTVGYIRLRRRLKREFYKPPSPEAIFQSKKSKTTVVERSNEDASNPPSGSSA